MLAASTDQTNDFEYAGQFAGFFRDVFGNSRMVLRTADQELFLGIAKPLHAGLAGMLAPGQEIVVAGRSFPGARISRLVSHVRAASQPVFARRIRICSKKKCWRTGGKAIWETLNRHIADSELEDTVRLETVDCLENCKRGPNLECDGSLFQNCTTGKAVELLTSKDEKFRSRH
jgi:Thioredoxin-like [2Fe-2S] ferredoxin